MRIANLQPNNSRFKLEQHEGCPDIPDNFSISRSIFSAINLNYDFTAPASCAGDNDPSSLIRYTYSAYTERALAVYWQIQELQINGCQCTGCAQISDALRKKYSGDQTFKSDVLEMFEQVATIYGIASQIFIFKDFLDHFHDAIRIEPSISKRDCFKEDLRILQRNLEKWRDTYNHAAEKYNLLIGNNPNPNRATDIYSLVINGVFHEEIAPKSLCPLTEGEYISSELEPSLRKFMELL